MAWPGSNSTSPEISQPEAFFVKDDTSLKVFAFWGARVAEDLMKARSNSRLLAQRDPKHSALARRGIAEYFEVARGEGGSTGLIFFIYPTNCDEKAGSQI